LFDLGGHEIKPKHVDETQEDIDDPIASFLDESVLINNNYELRLPDALEYALQEVRHTNHSNVVARIAKVRHID
jgi:hypothetical protein